MYQIEKNIPIPIKVFEFPFRDMEVGDSFFVPHNQESDLIRGRLNRAIQAFRKNNKGHKFTLRSIDDGFRIWRVS